MLAEVNIGYVKIFYPWLRFTRMIQVSFLVGVGASVVIGNLPGAVFTLYSFDESLHDIVARFQCYVISGVEV